MLHAVIMAGGSGTRFWPASRAALPKQLLRLVGQQTMLQSTVARLGDLVAPDRTLVLTNQRLVAAVGEQLPALPKSAIVGEPCKRDTAPCVGLAAALIQHQDPDATMLVMPADHVITPEATFRAAVQSAMRLLEQDPQRIATFGIRPSYAAETFGYIERGESLDGQGEVPVFRVQKFHEKPAASVAAQYVELGNFYWNSGIFLWRAATILSALQQYEPEMYQHLQAIAGAVGRADFDACLDREFSAINGKSIDFAVMERYPEVVVLEAPFEWDDLGSWHSLPRRQGADDEGNTIMGRHLGIATSGCIVQGDEEHLIVTLGMKDCIVVHTADATLVAHKEEEESIRRVVTILEEKNWSEYL
jgi:mannose-1-phosphate guanylyltransferase